MAGAIASVENITQTPTTLEPLREDPHRAAAAKGVVAVVVAAATVVVPPTTPIEELLAAAIAEAKAT
jgi:hypothetical protein